MDEDFLYKKEGVSSQGKRWLLHIKIKSFWNFGEDASLLNGEGDVSHMNWKAKVACFPA